MADPDNFNSKDFCAGYLAAWNRINAIIKHGDLPEPYASERNGMVSAANAVIRDYPFDYGRCVPHYH